MLALQLFYININCVCPGIYYVDYTNILSDYNKEGL